MEKAEPVDFQLNKFFYKEIGKKHKWVDRLIWKDKNWTDYINSPNVFTYILKNKEDLIGYFEQNFYYQKNDYILILYHLESQKIRV